MNKTTQTYHNVLQYFQVSDEKSQEPIAHPDTQVNRYAQKTLSELRKAAVLIPITKLANGKSDIVLTVRSANLNSHAGQISLPGGTTEPHDADETATALRESEEEIGLRAEHVEVIGKLGELALPSGFRVTPVVGIIENDLEFEPCPIEVADVFQVPLDLILDPHAYERSSVRYKDKDRAILELRYEDYRIWGATAAILHHLARDIANLEG